MANDLLTDLSLSLPCEAVTLLLMHGNPELRREVARGYARMAYALTAADPLAVRQALLSATDKLAILHYEQPLRSLTFDKQGIVKLLTGEVVSDFMGRLTGLSHYFDLVGIGRGGFKP